MTLLTPLSSLIPVLTTLPLPVWRVLPASEEAALVIEGRSKDRTLAGYSLNLSSGELLPLAVEFSWTESLVAVQGRVAIWQGLEDEGMPDPLGIIAVDIRTGREIWRQPLFKFIRSGPEVIVAQAPSSPGDVCYLSVESGTVRHQLAKEDIPSDLLDKFHQNRHSVVSFPLHLTPESIAYAGAASLLSAHMEKDPQGPISLLELDGLRVLHGYFKEDSILQSRILLIAEDQTSRLLPAGEYPSGYTTDPYFLLKEFLIWMEYPNKIGYLKI